MKNFSRVLISILVFSISSFSTAWAQTQTQSAPAKTIGIVLPLEHKALRAIINGFEETVTKEYPGKVTFIVENAQHDLNIQRAIIQKFMNQKVDLIVPIATAPTQMTIAMVKKQPIIGLAAMIPDSARQQNNLANRYTGVRDEIDNSKQMAFIHAILPKAKKITVIYSSDDKVIPEVAETITTAKTYGMTVQKLMIENLSDLYAVSQRVDPSSQAIFILKDNLVASGINTLILIAKNKHIPLISSDEGTVSQGATAALGVEETQIGIDGGKLAIRVLKGEPIASLPIENISNLVIFVNTKSITDLGLNMSIIHDFAANQKYTLTLNPSER